MERVLEASRQEAAQLLASLQRRANRTWTPMFPPPPSLEGAQPLVPGLHGNQRRSQPSASSGPAPRLWSPAPLCRLLPLLLLLMLGEGLV
ncbi:unnamed protein product [Boreogadus saida]